MPTPRHILFVHHRPELGGAPVSLSTLIANLDRDRFQATVYCPAGPSAELFGRSGAEVVIGPVASFTHIWASYYRGLRWLLCGRELAAAPASIRALTAVLRRGRFDLVHLNDSPLVYAAMAAYRHSLPVVWHLRSSLAGGGTDLRGRAIGRLIDRTAAAVIAIDSDVARSFDVTAPISVIHNSVDLTRFAPADSAEAKRRLGLRDDLVSIGLFGYLYARKGWPDFLRAARFLVRHDLPVQFVVVGGGVRTGAFFETPSGRILRAIGLASDEEQRARGMAHALGIDSQVHFLPFSADTRDLYLALDVVTFPSRGEGLGRAVIEAAACGRAVVASGSLDGAGLVLPDETGLLVPRHSPDSLAASLRRLVTDGELRTRIGAAARLYAEANFDPAVNAARVMDVYDNVLAGPSRRED